MHEEKALRSVYSYLAGEVSDRSIGDAVGAKFEENAFVEIVAGHLEEIGLIDESHVCFHQGRWNKGVFRVNGYAVSDEGERLDLFVAVYIKDELPRLIPHEEISHAAGQAARAIAAAKKGIHREMETASDSFFMMSRLAEMVGDETRQVRISVLTNGITSIKSIKPMRVEGIDVKFELYDLRRLGRTMMSDQAHDVIDIDIRALGLEPISCVGMPQNGEHYEAYLAIFPGEALFRIYDAYGPRLLEYNVRAFLQASGNVNRGIRDTIKDEPENFMAYNNGISVTVQELIAERSPHTGGLQIIGMKGLQIVNGGQTTASIHRARKRDRFDLSKVHVPAKITKLPTTLVDKMVPLISRYANTQNVIQEADFSSNEPFHVALERLSQRILPPVGGSRWFYERARGQYRTAMNKEGDTPARRRAFRERTPPSQKFSKTDAAKFLNSWACLPHVVSSGAQKNFVAFMRSLREVRGRDWEPDDVFFRELIGKAILFNSATRIIRKEQFPAYRANIVCYLISYLSAHTSGKLNFETLWKRQALSSGLEDLLRVWSYPVAETIQVSAAGRNVTEWCKKENCWLAVKELELSLPKTLPPELR